MNDANRTPGELVGPVSPNSSSVELSGVSGSRTIIPVPAPSPGAGSSLSPLSVLRALKRRLTLALALAFPVMAICSTAAYFLLPTPKFRATAQIRVLGQAPQVIFKTADGGLEGESGYRRYQRTQIGMLKSRSVVNQAIQQPGVRQLRIVNDQKDPVNWIVENLMAQFLQDSEIMEISLAGDDHDEVVKLLDAIVASYLDSVVGREQKVRESRQEQLKDLSKTYTALTKERREALRKIAQAAGSSDRQTLVLKQQYAMDHKNLIQRELSEVQSQKRKITSMIKALRPESLQETSAATEPADDVEAVIDTHPEVRALQDQLAERQQQLASEAAHTARVSRKSSMDPGIKALRDEVAALKRQLRAKREAVRPLALKQLQQPRRDTNPNRGLTLPQQLQIVEETERSLQDEFDKLSQSDIKLNENTLDIRDYEDELKQFQDNAEKINHEVEILKVELNAPPRITLMEKAQASTMRDSKKWYMMFGMVTAGSFLATLLGIAFLELQAHKVDTVDEVVMGLGLPVVGSLPMLPARARQGGAMATTTKDRYWYNLLLESIDATRTMLIHAARNGSHRVVMITSALAGEGKTSLASHLATSLARSGHKTLLIDADLRRPSIHRLFDLTADPGMSELLRGEVALEDVIASTAIEELKVITAGQCDHLTLRILSQGGMGSHFAAFKEAFDFVIVDSSPVLPVADALIIAQQVDAVLFSVLTDVSRKDKIQGAYQRLVNLGVRVLGAVVTGAHDGTYGTHYYPGELYGSPLKSADTSSEAEAAS